MKRDKYPDVMQLEKLFANITCDLDEQGKLVTIIECIVCSKHIRLGYQKNRTRNGNSYNFNNTNFFHHLRTHFK